MFITCKFHQYRLGKTIWKILHANEGRNKNNTCGFCQASRIAKLLKEQTHITVWRMWFLRIQDRNIFVWVIVLKESELISLLILLGIQLHWPESRWNYQQIWFEGDIQSTRWVTLLWLWNNNLCNFKNFSLLKILADRNENFPGTWLPVFQQKVIKFWSLPNLKARFNQIVCLSTALFMDTTRTLCSKFMVRVVRCKGLH